MSGKIEFNTASEQLCKHAVAGSHECYMYRIRLQRGRAPIGADRGNAGCAAANGECAGADGQVRSDLIRLRQAKDSGAGYEVLSSGVRRYRAD